jgi:dipeptidyl aminopeptidase/acylaminoacyl peptidase
MNAVRAACFILLCCAQPGLAQELSSKSAIARRWSWEQRHADDFGHVTAQWIANTHDLLYTRQLGTRSQIVRFAVNTGHMTPIVDGLVPVASPDGHRIAFVRHADSSAQTRHGRMREEIWIADADGKGVRRVLRLPEPQRSWQCISLSWAPDSSRLLYSSCPVREPSMQRVAVQVFPGASESHLFSELHLLDTRTMHDRLLLGHRGEIGRSGWRDNSAIWYVRDNGKGANELWSRIEQLNVNTSATSVLIDDLQHQIFYEPVFNPGATRMALLIDSRGPAAPYYPIRSDLAIWNADSASIGYVAKDIGENTEFAWTPDGSGVVFARGPSTRTQLYVGHPNDLPRRLTFADGDDGGPAFTADGTLLVWRHRPIGRAPQLWIGRWVDDELRDAHELLVLEDDSSAASAANRWTALRWNSPDGTPVDGLLRLPARPDGGKAHPLAVILHGGPQSKLDPLAGEWPGGQYFIEVLLQRGFAVFLPDYRSSGAAGFDAMQRSSSAGQEILDGDLTDVMSGIDPLISHGVVDPKRLVLLGHSWGSVEVNWALTHTPRFAAAVSYEGGDLLLGWGTRRGPDLSLQWSVGKSPVEDWPLWESNSALSHVRGVTTPALFVSCGRGLSSATAEWLYAAWMQQHVPTELVVYPDEPHIVSDAAAQLDLLDRILLWLDKYAFKH